MSSNIVWAHLLQNNQPFCQTAAVTYFTNWVGHVAFPWPIKGRERDRLLGIGSNVFIFFQQPDTTRDFLVRDTRNTLQTETLESHSTMKMCFPRKESTNWRVSSDEPDQGTWPARPGPGLQECHVMTWKGQLSDSELSSAQVTQAGPRSSMQHLMHFSSLFTYTWK